MQTQNRKYILYQLLVQIMICVLYAFGLINVLIRAGQTEGIGGLLAPAVKYGPFLVVLICSILPQAALLIKHKLHSQDGEILPVLFTSVILQACIIIVDALDSIGYFFEYPLQLLVLERFSLLAAASMFLVSSLRYFGFSSSHIGLYNLAFLAVSFLISAAIPVSSYMGETDINMSLYEVYLQVLVLVIYITAVVTFIVIAVKDKTALNIKRSIAFILLIGGLYTSHIGLLWSAILSPVLYITGTVILVVNVGDSF